MKKDVKNPVDFKKEKDNLLQLKYFLQDKHGCFFGNVTDKEFVQMIMKMNLNTRNTRRKLKSCISRTKWPKWIDNNRESIWNILEKRMNELLKLLPYCEIEPKNSPQEIPTPRDGHG